MAEDVAEVSASSRDAVDVGLVGRVQGIVKSYLVCVQLLSGVKVVLGVGHSRLLQSTCIVVVGACKLVRIIDEELLDGGLELGLAVLIPRALVTRVRNQVIVVVNNQLRRETLQRRRKSLAC